MPIRAFLNGGERSGFTWPLGVEEILHGLPTIPSWRQFGHSWTGGFDDPRLETGFPERLAGVLGVPGAFFENYGVFGSSIMDHVNGFGYYLHNTSKSSLMDVWPWEPYHGVDGFLWGVNDFGTRHCTGMMTAGWPTQRDMWRSVWREAWRSIIQRSIAGGIFPGERLGPTSWLSGIAGPWTDHATGTHPTVVYGGPGTWSFNPNSNWTAPSGKVYKVQGTGPGRWRTSTTGATITITVPADYDTSYLVFRHTVPGSYYPGTQTHYGSDGTGPFVDPPGPDPPPVAASGLPVFTMGDAASEVLQAPVNVTIATAGVTSKVRALQLLKDRRVYAASSVLNTMTVVDRIAVPSTPNTTRTVTITVGSIPAGGWYEFDSWEIEARQENRPPVVVANVAPPAWWAIIYFLGVNTWPGMNTTAELASEDVASVCAEWGDPGICVADVRAALAGHEVDYAALYPAGVTPATGGGVGTGPMRGDGTHPHSIGSRLIAGAFRDALARAGLPTSRYAQAFGPERDVERA